MSFPKGLLRRLRTLVAPRRVAREIADEMELHVALETEDLIRQGVDPAEARRQARVAFGGVDQYTEQARDAWPLRWLQRVIADLRFASRSLRRAPSFTITAVVALAIAMGANATVFSAVDSVAFRPLAVREPDALVALYGAQGEANLLTFSFPTYQDLRRGATAFADMVAFTEGPVSVLVAGAPAAVWAMHTTDNYFATLGVQAGRGAFYREGDAAPVVVLSDAFWAAAFARDPAVVGRTLTINGSTFTIVAVAPAQFTGTRLFTYDPALWIPVTAHPQTIPSSIGLLTRRDASRFHVIGRLRGGVTIAQAQAGGDAVAHHLGEAFPEQYRGLHINLMSNRRPINPWLAPPERITLIGQLMVLGALFVLVIAAVNVAGLFVARMGERRQEIAVRLSLGAGTRRITQQLLTESLVIAALGALASIPVHLLASRGMGALMPHLEYASTFRPAADTRVFAYSVLLTVAVALVCGLGPALQATGRSFVAGLRDVTGAGGARWTRFRELLVGGQALVSALLLVAGGLFVRSFAQARRMDPGFAVDGAVAFTLHPELSPAYDATRTRVLYRRLDEALAAIPGVQSTARAAGLPLDGWGAVRRVFTEDGPTELAQAPVAELNIVTPRYFATLGTPIIAGREFHPADTGAATDGVIVNDLLARRLWPGAAALGRRLRLESPSGPELEVIGVARASLYRTLGERPRPALWLNLDRNPRSRSTTLVRVRGPDAALVAPVRAAIHALDPALPIVGLGTFRQHISVAYVSIESGAIGALAFGLLALVLAASGVYGLTAYAVTQRRREIGIRVALGATGAAVLRLVAGRALTLTLVGAAAGALLAALVPMGLDSLLFGVSRYDPRALAGAMAVFGVVAVVAALVAARRALGLDPMQVLRLD
jgi:predicted permease